jgi:hypothetical protein
MQVSSARGRRFARTMSTAAARYSIGSRCLRRPRALISSAKSGFERLSKFPPAMRRAAAGRCSGGSLRPMSASSRQALSRSRIRFPPWPPWESTSSRQSASSKRIICGDLSSLHGKLVLAMSTMRYSSLCIVERIAPTTRLRDSCGRLRTRDARSFQSDRKFSLYESWEIASIRISSCTSQGRCFRILTSAYAAERDALSPGGGLRARLRRWERNSARCVSSKAPNQSEDASKANHP